MDYEVTAEKLTQRILTLIPDNPKILEMDEPWSLFDLGGFYCNDLEPTLGQASWALQRAKYLYAQKKRPNNVNKDV